MKNFLIKSALTIHDNLFPRKHQRGEIPRILIVSTTGIGDTLWGTPAIRALRKQHPNGHIAILTSTWGAALLQANPHLDEIYDISQKKISLLATLRKNQFDTAFIFHTSQRLALPLTYLARPATLVGTLGMHKGLDAYLSRPLSPTPIHEIKRRLLVVEAEDESPVMELFLTEEDQKEAHAFLNEQRLHSEKLLIGLHPGANNPFKQWNPDHFITLGKRLSKIKKAKIVITGNQREANLAKTIAKAIPGALSLAGKFSLRVTAALMQKFHHFITNDTGPMHIAFAIGTPTTALFCPTDPKICGPFETHGYAKAISYPPACVPCLKKGCYSPFCMEQISPKEVFDSVIEQLP